MSKPQRTVEDQQFLDIAAIQIFAKLTTEGKTERQAMEIAAMACEDAELLLNERNKRK